MRLVDESLDLQEGMVLLDRYTILDRVAGGGMATIFRATDARLDRVVCVKLLRRVVERPGSDGARKLYAASYSHFLKEALALSKLQHPNTLRIYDFGYLDEKAPSVVTADPALAQPRGRPFQISEFLDGGNLDQFVRARGALSAKETLSVLDPITGAVAEAHAHGILHRDIKPSNILFSRVGGVLMPKLADFGISRADLRPETVSGDEDELTDDDAQPTSVLSQVPLFSPRWAAPEQLAEREEGPTADVYALALVAIYMLSGRPPFDVADVRSTFAERVRADDYVARRLAALSIDGRIGAVLLEALRANPAVRTPSPRALYEALSGAIGEAGASLPAPPLAFRPRAESITLDFTGGSERSPASSVAPEERWLDVGGRRVRLLVVHEKVDFTMRVAESVDVRFRVTLLPARSAPFRLHIKGLNCFVAAPGSPASPAIVADQGGIGEFVSMTRERLASVAWSFGTLSEGARIFRVGSAELSVPFPDGERALVLELGAERELIVVCRETVSPRE